MSNVNHIGAPKALTASQLQPPETKAYQAKANMAGGSELATWLEEATAWVSAVRSGQAQDDPNIPVWQYEQWIQQVSSQIYGSGMGGGWSPMMGGGGMAPAQVQPPPGAIVGADGNFVFDSKNADLIYDGNATQHVVNSTDVRLAVDSMGASYSFSEVTDATGETVLKLVVDGPKGQQTYVFNNYTDDDFHLDLYAANIDNVNLPAEIDAGKVTPKDIEELGEELATGGDVTLDGQPVEAETITEPGTDGTGGVYKYEATSIDETFQLRPTAGPDNPTNYVVGNATITVPLSSTVAVTAASAPENTLEALTFDYKVVVTHSDGTKDTYFVQKDYNYQINAKEGSVSFDGAPDTDGAIPQTFIDAGFSTTASVEAGAAGGGAGTDTLAAFVAQLGNDKTPDNVLSAFKQDGIDLLGDDATLEDLKALFASEDFPPTPPSKELLDALMVLDDDLYNNWNEMVNNSDFDDAKVSEYMESLVGYLETLYPNGTNIRPEPDNSQYPFAFSINGNIFAISQSDGKVYDVTT